MNMRPNAAGNDDLKRMARGGRVNLCSSPGESADARGAAGTGCELEHVYSRRRRPHVRCTAASGVARQRYPLPDWLPTRCLAQRWTLMPYSLLCGCLTPTAIMRYVQRTQLSWHSDVNLVRGRREVFGSYPGEKNMSRFPAWLVRQFS